LTYHVAVVWAQEWLAFLTALDTAPEVHTARTACLLLRNRRFPAYQEKEGRRREGGILACKERGRYRATFGCRGNVSSLSDSAGLETSHVQMTVNINHGAYLDHLALEIGAAINHRRRSVLPIPDHFDGPEEVVPSLIIGIRASERERSIGGFLRSMESVVRRCTST